MLTRSMAKNQKVHPVPDLFRLSDTIWMYRNKKLLEHGNIYLGELRSSITGKRLIVIKLVQNDKYSRNEANILEKLNENPHTNILPLIHSDICRYGFEEYLYIAMEKCHSENIRQFVMNRKDKCCPFDYNFSIALAQQIISGVEFIHSKKIIHKDLKPDNILFSLDQTLIRIADFGISEEIESLSTRIYKKQQFGTDGYRPFESYGNGVISLKTDIFSLGAVLHFLLSNGEHPFGNVPELWSYNVKRDRGMNLSGLLVPNAKTTRHLIRCMLSFKRCNRPTIQDVSSHPCWTGAEVECNFDFECEETEVDTPYICSEVLPRTTTRANITSWQKFFEQKDKFDRAQRQAEDNPSATDVDGALSDTVLLLDDQARLSGMDTMRGELVEMKSGHRDLRIPPNKITDLRGHNSDVYTCAWNPTCDLLASCSHDSTARIWNLKDEYGPAASSTGGQIVLRHYIKERNLKIPTYGFMKTLDWNSDGTMLATCSTDGYARIWTKEGDLCNFMTQKKGPMQTLKWNKQGNYIVTSEHDDTTVVWNAKSGALVQQFSFHNGTIIDVDWRDNICFASCSSDREIHVAKLGCEKPVKTFTGHVNAVFAVEWDPSERLLASCSYDTTVKVWSTDQDSFVHDLRDHSAEVRAIKWSPPGCQNLLLASGSFDKTVRLWEPERGVCLRTLIRHQALVRSMSFSPDGMLLASGSYDKCVYIWNTQSGRLVRSYKGIDWITKVCWNAAGTKVGASALGGIVTVLDLRK